MCLDPHQEPVEMTASGSTTGVGHPILQLRRPRSGSTTGCCSGLRRCHGCANLQLRQPLHGKWGILTYFARTYIYVCLFAGLDMASGLTYKCMFVCMFGLGFGPYKTLNDFKFMPMHLYCDFLDKLLFHISNLSCQDLWSEVYCTIDASKDIPKNF